MFSIKKNPPVTFSHLILTPPFPTREINLQNITEKLNSLVINPVATSVFWDTVQFIFVEYINSGEKFKWEFSKTFLMNPKLDYI